MSDDSSLTEVLIECVKAAGGSKVVGAKLWPDLGVDQAQRKLLDTLNDDRPHRLTPDQALLVAGMARAAGCHAYMRHCSARLHYAMPAAIDPRDEMAELQRQFIAAAHDQRALLERIEALGAQTAAGGLRAVG